MIASLLVSVIALVSSSSAAFNGTITQSDQTIQDILSSNQSYSNFTKVLKNSKPLAPLFQESGANYTVFAPSDKALSAIPSWILATIEESKAIQTLLVAMHISNETWSLPEASGAATGGTEYPQESTLQRRQEQEAQNGQQEGPQGQDEEQGGSQYEGGALPQPPSPRPKARTERGRVILSSLLGTNITLSRKGRQLLVNDMGKIDFIAKGSNGFVVGIDSVLGAEGQQQQPSGQGQQQPEQQQTNQQQQQPTQTQTQQPQQTQQA